MIIRGDQILRDNPYIGKSIFLSLHALRGSSQRNYRGTLTKVTDTHVHLQGHDPIFIDLKVYDAIMSQNN